MNVDEKDDARSKSLVDSIDWQEAYKEPFIPRGVYRFASHEEADEWLAKVFLRKKGDEAHNRSKQNPNSTNLQ